MVRRGADLCDGEIAVASVAFAIVVGLSFTVNGDSGWVSLGLS